MIQFNLLPDVKLAYIKTARRKRLVMASASAVIGLSLAMLVILFIVVNVIQKRHLNALSADINEQVKTLQDNPDLGKILTVQNQLMSLGALHDQKPVATRLFTYLEQVTPLEVSIAKFDIDFEGKTIRISGASDSLANVNKFVDTLKFTNFKTLATDDKPASEEKPAFSNVVMTSFGRTQLEASYTIDLMYDAAIFDSAAEVELKVPTTITTRSETEKPLFQGLKEEQ